MASKSKSKKGRKKKKGAGAGPLLTREQQLDIVAVGLLALALLVALALLPVSIFGSAGTELFPSGNAVGPLGGAVRGALLAVIGLAAGLVPLLLLFGGLRAGGWGPDEWTGRLALLIGGLVVVLPVGLHVLAPDPGAGGWLGEWLGGPLVGILGWLGTTILLGVLLVVLSVVTIEWNPVRSAWRGMRSGGALAGRGLRDVGDRLDAYRTRAAARPDAADALAGPEEDEKPFAPEGREDEAPAAAADAPDAARVDEAPRPPRPRTVGELLPDPTHPARLAGTELPPIELLKEPERAGREGMEKELDRLGRVLVDKLETFNVRSELGGRTTGPVVTQYEVVPAAGVKVNRIANLDADLALAMKAPSIRIVAPIPGKGAVGVEIPNPRPEVVRLREILEAREFKRARGSLPLGLGKDLTGRPYVADLTKMPHLLIAGATGSGKSVCVNTLITSMVYRHTPETLRLLMIDPKMVELSAYSDLPHLRHPVVTDPQDAAGVLKWAVLEMERRYQLLSANGVRSVAEFNGRVKDGTPLRRVEPRDGEDGGGDAGGVDEDRWIYDEGILPYVVVVVEELADLIMQVQSEVERPLAQLAQKARAIGIHLVVATQRPSVNVITGLIKANFPTRIAFRVASKTDSRTILDQNGAESLLGDGDMLFLPPGESEPVRIQGAFVETRETDGLLAWFREREEEREAARTPVEIFREGEPDILEQVRASEQVSAEDVVDEIMEDWDELFRAAAEVCISQNQGSTSLLQRRLRIGYGRAARIVDQLHEAGIVGPPDGSKPREVLVTMAELDSICGPAT
ncbi:MAG: DNA translocase FtsK [Gemmatimonadota bacterium]